MYTREQKEKALAMYDATQSIAEVIHRLGYPSKQALYTWIANRDKPWQKPNGFRGVNTAEYPRHPSVNLKIFAKPLDKNVVMWYTVQVGRNAGIAQLVEHVIGNDEVISSNLITSSREARCENSEPLFIFALL